MAQLQFSTSDTIYWPYGYGDGSDGDATLSGQTAQGDSGGIAGSSGGTQLTGVSGYPEFADNALVGIYQVTGTNYGTWQLNRIKGSAGSTTNLFHSLVTNFSSSGNNRAYMVEVKQYRNVTINSGATLRDWDGAQGGWDIVLANGTITVNAFSGAGKGMRGGVAGSQSSDDATAEGGDGGGYPQIRNKTHNNGDRNGSGGGGGDAYPSINRGGCGGGGANATNGGNGPANSTDDGFTRTAEGGVAYGSSDLRTFSIGGGGGGGAASNNGPGEPGGDGGGGLILIAPSVTIIGTVDLKGNDGESRAVAYEGAGGGGAGGSLLIKGINVNIGSNKVDLRGGAGGTVNWATAGAGGKGRVRIEYASSLTGSLSSTYYGSYSTAQDSTLTHREDYGAMI